MANDVLDLGVVGERPAKQLHEFSQVGLVEVLLQELAEKKPWGSAAALQRSPEMSTPGRDTAWPEQQPRGEPASPLPSNCQAERLGPYLGTGLAVVREVAHIRPAQVVSLAEHSRGHAQVETGPPVLSSHGRLLHGPGPAHHLLLGWETVQPPHLEGARQKREVTVAYGR